MNTDIQMNNQLENSRGHHRNHQSKYPLQQYPYTQGNQQETGFLQDSKVGSSHLEFSSTILAFWSAKKYGCWMHFSGPIPAFSTAIQTLAPRELMAQEHKRESAWLQMERLWNPSQLAGQSSCQQPVFPYRQTGQLGYSQLLRTGLIELCLPSF